MQMERGVVCDGSWGNGNLREVEDEGGRIGRCHSTSSPADAGLNCTYVRKATPLPGYLWNRERADQLCGRRCICGY